MELITILRELWRRRWLVVASAVLAAAAGLLLLYRVTLPTKVESRQYKVALGTVNVLVDTPDSQVIDLNPKGVDAVGTRANLLANLITTTPIKNAIAKHLQMPAKDLVVLAPPSGGVLASNPTQTKGAVDTAGRNAKIIAIRTDPQLPVISIDTQAPDTATAARLADGAVAGLEDYLKSVAATQSVPTARQLVLRQLGEAQVAEATRGPRRMFGVVFAFFLFGAACAAIVIVPGVARGLRAAAEAEAAGADTARRLAVGDPEAVHSAGASAGQRDYVEYVDDVDGYLDEGSLPSGWPTPTGSEPTTEPSSQAGTVAHPGRLSARQSGIR
jgi:hypothetical protein